MSPQAKPLRLYNLPDFARSVRLRCLYRTTTLCPALFRLTSYIPSISSDDAVERGGPRMTHVSAL